MPSWSVFERGQQDPQPGLGEAQVLAVDADQLGPAQRPGEADQQQGAVAQPGGVAAAHRDQLLQLGRGQRRGLAAAAAVLAGDALQGGADRRVAGRPGQAAQPVLLADGGEAPVERGAAVEPGERGEVGGDRGGRRRQRRAAGLGAPAQQKCRQSAA